MKTNIHRSASRGRADHGWLQSFHTFSFSGFQDPSKIHFGALRVLNDDTVSGGMGFGKHPHENMEIVSIPLSGELEHQDSMGNTAVIRKGEVQIMSAGTGIYHSEKNKKPNEPVKFLQIWVFPERKNITPRYDQQLFDAAGRRNTFQTVVSPMDSPDAGVKINQQAWFSLIDMDPDKTVNYALKRPGNGAYLFVLKGSIRIDNELLNERDGIEITGAVDFDVLSAADAEILIMDIPLQF